MNMGSLVDPCSRGSSVFFLWVCLFGLAVGSVLGKVSPTPFGRIRRFKWEIEYVYKTPDCLEHAVIGINKEFPGPTIRANAGDMIVVELTNHLHTEGVVIHWHGIRQLGTPWADGTAAISQCAINPGETFNYTFTVDREGTYFYHGHYGMQRSAGLYGSLIVDVAKGKKEPFSYDGEFNFLLSDLWHKNVHEQELDLSSSPLRWIGEPQSLLINGRGQFNCSLAARYGNSSLSECRFRGNESCAPKMLSVLPNKTYRLRIASTTALASLNLQIGNHKMVVVEADGNYVEPFTVNDIDIYSGESYSVLFKTDQNPTKNYWISIGVRGRLPRTPQALTLINYRPTNTRRLPESPPPVTPLWNNYTHSKIFARSQRSTGRVPTPPLMYDRRIILLNTQNLIGRQTKWAINNVSLTLPATPYLGAIKHEVGDAFDRSPPPESFSASYDVMAPGPNPNTSTGSGVYTLTFGKTVDIILQNSNALQANVSEIHPWHLHGHDFWILGYGEGKFKDSDEKSFNLKNPPAKNTAVIFPFGWTALRFVADNPGVWAFHCHIEPHLHMGMGVVFAEGVHLVKNIPRSAMACGLTANIKRGKTKN